jgi:hypothetical protein
VMATSLLRCTECDAVRDTSSLPPGWYHHTRREERQRIWPTRCPLCGHTSLPSAPTIMAVEMPKAAADTTEATDADARATSVPNPRMDLANLEAMWAYVTTQRERAQIEAQMWEIAKPTLPRASRKSGISKWLGARLQEPHDVIEDRHMLHRQGLTVNELWDRVDGGERMLVRRAAQILSKAKLRAVSESISLRDAINSELADYSKGTLIITPAGTFRRREQRVRGTLKGAATSPQASGRKRAVEVGAARDLWVALRASVKRIVDHELRGLGGTPAKEQLQGQMEAELEGMIRALQSRAQRARNTVHLDGAPAVVSNPADERKTLKLACQTLSVDPPHGGIDVDFALYKRAKTNYRRLVLEYHPDHGGGDTARYDAVVKAMSVVEERYQATTSSSATATKNSSTNDKDP